MPQRNIVSESFLKGFMKRHQIRDRIENFEEWGCESLGRGGSWGGFVSLGGWFCESWGWLPEGLVVTGVRGRVRSGAFLSNIHRLARPSAIRPVHDYAIREGWTLFGFEGKARIWRMSSPRPLIPMPRGTSKTPPATLLKYKRCKQGGRGH